MTIHRGWWNTDLIKLTDRFYRELDLQLESSYDDDNGFQFINWMINNLGAKICVQKSKQQQNNRSSSSILCSLDLAVTSQFSSLTLTAEPSFSTEFKSWIVLTQTVERCQADEKDSWFHFGFLDSSLHDFKASYPQSTQISNRQKGNPNGKVSCSGSSFYVSSLVIKLKFVLFLLKHCYSLDSLVQGLALGGLLVMSKANLRMEWGWHLSSDRAH